MVCVFAEKLSKQLTQAIIYNKHDWFRVYMGLFVVKGQHLFSFMIRNAAI